MTQTNNLGTFGADVSLTLANPPSPEDQRRAGLTLAVAAVARDDFDGLRETCQMLGRVESPPPIHPRDSRGLVREASGARGRRKGRGA